MIDFTHKKRPEFVQLVLIIAVVCLALGAITPAASAAAYDWEFSVIPPGDDPSGEISGTAAYEYHGSSTTLYGALSDGSDISFTYSYRPVGTNWLGYYTTLNNFYNLSDVPYTSLYPYRDSYWVGYYFCKVAVVDPLPDQSVNYYPQLVAEFLMMHTDIAPSMIVIYDPERTQFILPSTTSISYSYELAVSSYPFYVDIVDSGTDYLISVSGFDGTQLAGSAYTIGVSTWSGGYKLKLSNFPMYQGDSPVHFWTSDQTFTLPVYLSDGVTPIDYYCILSFPADPTHQTFPFWWNLTTSGSITPPYDTTNPPIVPTPTPLIPSVIIPDPEDLNNTVNFTGWYQDQGFEGNIITAPIYSGLRGWFSENLIPVFDFFLMPIGSLSSMISESAGTAIDAIDDSVEQLSIYAAPMTMVGGYVVLLVPDVVWVVVFAALSIGYVVLLIRISTGSIRDTINRFLGGR